MALGLRRKRRQEGKQKHHDVTVGFSPEYCWFTWQSREGDLDVELSACTIFGVSLLGRTNTPINAVCG